MRYRYDELERRVEASYPNTHPGKDEQVRYRYDSCPLGLGRLCERHDESGRTACRYDVWGNVVEREHEELGVRYHTRYSWDREDKLSRMELPSGRVVEYSRDGVRRLLGLQVDSKGDIFVDKHGNLYEGTSQGTGTPQPLGINKYAI